MYSLFGDRYLRLFAGDLHQRLKRTISDGKDQNLEAIAEDASELVVPAFEEGCEKNLAEGNQLLNEEEQNNKKDTARYDERDWIR